MSTEPFHPGLSLKEELALRAWTQTDLSFILGCNVKNINEIISGKRGISPEMSKSLGEALSLAPGYFLNLQKEYDLSRVKSSDDAILIRANMQKSYPVREMIKRGWLKDLKANELAVELANFFEVSGPDKIPYLNHAAKKTDYETISPTQLAWLFRVKKIAKSISVPQYSEKLLRQSLVQLRELLLEPEHTRHVPKILSNCGIRFIVVEALPQSKIDGVCFWLTENSPVIGMSMRYDRIDNFWFVLRHEIEHVLNADGKTNIGMVDSELGFSDDKFLPEEERIANLAASEFCVPSAKIESFIIRKNPFYYEKDVVAFSKIQGIHPGITVGQIQRRIHKYDYLRKYQVKIRQFVLPGAIADGWGQAIPI